MVSGLPEVPIVHGQSNLFYFAIFNHFWNYAFVTCTNIFEQSLLNRTIDSVCNIGWLPLLISSLFLSAFNINPVAK